VLLSICYGLVVVIVSVRATTPSFHGRIYLCCLLIFFTADEAENREPRTENREPRTENLVLSDILYSRRPLQFEISDSRPCRQWTSSVRCVLGGQESKPMLLRSGKRLPTHQKQVKTSFSVLTSAPLVMNVLCV